MAVGVLFMCLIGALPMIDTIAVLDFEVDISDPNLIFLECLASDGQRSIDALFEFFEPVTRALRSRIRSSNGNRLTFHVTPQTEAIICCKIDGIPSENVSIAGKSIISASLLWSMSKPF